MMRRLLLATATALVLAGCASDEPQPASPPAAPAPVLAPPPPVSRPAPAPPPAAPPPPSRDACGADEAQKLVGRPRTEVPVPILPALQRVACTTCPVTQDFNPRRLNFFYEASTGIIKQVKCG